MLNHLSRYSNAHRVMCQGDKGFDDFVESFVHSYKELSKGLFDA